MSTRTPPPTLGHDLHTIHHAWRELSKMATSQHVVSAFVPLLGRFAYRHGEIVKIITLQDSRGYASVTQRPTPHELAELDHAIQAGWAEIEARTASGALGYGDGGHRTRLYHQSTGTPLPTCTTPTPRKAAQ